MSPAFHYLVKAKLIRFIKNDKVDFIEINQTFTNDNPIEARELAFSFYQNHVDVLLQGLGKHYISHNQAKVELEIFLNSGKIITWDEHPEIKVPQSLGNGIGIYMIVDKPIAGDQSGEEFIIHSIEFGGGGAHALMDGLINEYNYYNHYGYDFKHYKQVINFIDEGEVEADSNEILQTPFDWTGYDINDNATSKKQEESKNTITYEDLIQRGESNQVEFKPCLLYYHDKEGLNSGYRMSIRHIIAKVICSFLNSNGGFLFIGVGDDKQIQGLKDDFSLVQPTTKDPKDYFLLEIDKLIRHYFKTVASNIQGDFVTIDGTEIYVFTVFPSKYHPVFINGRLGKEFYARFAASSEPFNDMEDLAIYCLNKWGNQGSS